MKELQTFQGHKMILLKMYLLACCHQVRPDVWERSLVEGRSHEQSLCCRFSRCVEGTDAVFQSNETNNTICHHSERMLDTSS